MDVSPLVWQPLQSCRDQADLTALPIMSKTVGKQAWFSFSFFCPRWGLRGEKFSCIRLSSGGYSNTCIWKYMSIENIAEKNCSLKCLSLQCFIIACLKWFFCIFLCVFFKHRCENELFLSWLLLQKTCGYWNYATIQLEGLGVSAWAKKTRMEISVRFHSRNMRNKLRRGGFLIKDVSALWGWLWKPK